MRDTADRRDVDDLSRLALDLDHLAAALDEFALLIDENDRHRLVEVFARRLEHRTRSA